MVCALHMYIHVVFQYKVENINNAAVNILVAISL